MGEFVDELIELFKIYPVIFPAGYFSHLKQHLQHHIDSHQILYKNGVLLTWDRYKRRVGFTDLQCAQKDDYVIRQIVSRSQGNGAASAVLCGFIDQIQKPTQVWLSVRKDNARAVAFYLKHGFSVVATKWWSNHTVEGYIMKRSV